MTVLFLKLLNMSISASWLALAIIIIRLVFKKMPKWTSCLLWGILALRLIFPAHFKSALSLIPSAEVIPQNIAVTQTPAIYSGIPAINSVVNPLFVESEPAPGLTLDVIINYGAKIWLIGVIVMLLYSLITYLRLYRLVRVSLHRDDNVYLCDDVSTPFLLGLIRPKIYVPTDIDDDSIEYVLLHENAHLKRRDHLWKPLGFLLLSIYWYNPLMWLAYSLLCRDIELACDEKVIIKMDNTGKAQYSAALAACSIHPKLLAACPVAFGETGVKTRIKSVLHYKKPALWLIITSVLICSVIAVCFLTDPLPCIHNYKSEITLAATCTHEGVSQLTCTECQHCYAQTLDIIDHSYEHSTVTQPTCTHSGTELYTCTSCGVQHTEMLALLPHAANGEVFVTESNCTQHGQISIACSECGTICSTESLPTNNEHDLHETVIRKASCTSTGESVFSCSRCDYSETHTYPALGHDFVETFTATPTCSHPVMLVTTCTRCTYIEHTLSYMANHNFVYAGNGYECCTGCGLRRSINQTSPLFGTSHTGTTPGIPVISWDTPNKP